jgi:hypothetical protein
MGPGVRKKFKSEHTYYLLTSNILWLCLITEISVALQLTPCYKSRRVFNSSWGIITDGPSGSNYTQDSHCEWLIKGNTYMKFFYA